MIGEEIYKVYYTNLLTGSRAACSQIVNNLMKDGIPIKDLYLDLFQRSLYQVGSDWENNRISVATEHMCTAITESMINLCYPVIFAANHCGKSAVITCAPGEFHQIGARMVADFFELHGWDGYFLASDTPQADLIRFLQDRNPDLVAISMSVFFSLPKLKELVATIRDHFHDIDILVGGQGFRWGGSEAFTLMEHVYPISSLEDLEKRFLIPN